MNNMKYLNAVLTVLAVLLTLNLWVGANPSTSGTMSFESQAVAAPETPIDSRTQRAEMIAELKKLSSSVDAMSKKLTDGSMKVKVESMPEHD